MFLNRNLFMAHIAELNSDYWNEGADYRWEYMEFAISELRRIGAGTICEAGASGIPLCSSSYLMDLPDHNLDKVPYHFIHRSEDKIDRIKIENKKFDAFVALQVWEHLDYPADAFREVMRISKSAILSLPYKWTYGDKRHRGIDMAKIAAITCNVQPENIRFIKNRIVYTWRFE